MAGLREYVTGRSAMLQFDRVRVCLRSQRCLDANLTEVPQHNALAELFPPMVCRGAPPYAAIDWDTLLDVPVLLWYPPFRLPRYEDPDARGQLVASQVMLEVRSHLQSVAGDPEDERVLFVSTYYSYRTPTHHIVAAPDQEVASEQGGRAVLGRVRRALQGAHRGHR